MSWKTNIQLIDLDPNQKLEVTCKSCGHSRYERVFLLCTKMGMGFEYLDEVERKLFCQKAGCQGAVRIALTNKSEVEGFIGGLP